MSETDEAGELRAGDLKGSRYARGTTTDGFAHAATRFPISDAGQPNASQSEAIAFAWARVTQRISLPERRRRALGPHPRSNGGRTRRWRMDTGSCSRNAWSTRVFV